MVFVSPQYLVLAALLLPAAALLLVRAERRRRRDLALFAEPALLAHTSALPGRWARAAGHALALAGLALVLVALARPRAGATPSTRTGSGRDVLFLLDISRSMAAEDVAPSRLAAAKRAAGAIARALPDDRVGLVVFGGSAFLQLPLTLDHASFARFLDAASTSDLPDPGTSLEAAAATAGAAFEHDGEPDYRVAVVLSDGEDLEGEIDRAVAALGRERVRTFAVGVGTAGGGPIPERDSVGAPTYHRDWAGRQVTTRLVAENLRRVARATGGDYVTWDASERGARRLAGEIATLRARRTASTAMEQGADRFQWPLALALVALGGEPLLRDMRRRQRAR